MQWKKRVQDDVERTMNAMICSESLICADWKMGSSVVGLPRMQRVVQ